MTIRTDDPRQEELVGLLNAFIDSEPRLRIWADYPDITEAEDDATDYWACVQVSTEFAAFARTHGWQACVVRATSPEHPMAFDHAWVRLARDGVVSDVDWTARQFHSLHEPDGHDRNILDLPWPLAWDPAAIAPEDHPIVGIYAALKLENR